LSEGGLAIGLAECCMTDRNNQIGCDVSVDSDLRPDVLLFSESQSRYIITTTAQDLDHVTDKLRGAAIPFAEIGAVCGDRLRIGSLVDCQVSDLSKAHYETLYRYMDQPIQV
jgi:phosphoribosylformylglycinamidine synthase